MDLTAFSIELFKQIDGWVSPKFKSLEKRVGSLEKHAKHSIADAHKGTYSEQMEYQRGDLLTHSGSLWLAQTKTTRKPGNSGDWTLIVKRGDAR